MHIKGSSSCTANIANRVSQSASPVPLAFPENIGAERLYHEQANGNLKMADRFTGHATLSDWLAPAL